MSSTFRRSSLVAIGLLCMGLTGCLGARRQAEVGPDVDFGEPESSYGITSRRGEQWSQPEASTLEPHALMTVAPDRALVRIDIEVDADGYAAARQRAQDAGRRVQARISAVDGCEARLEASNTPKARRKGAWTGSVVVALDAAMMDAGDIDARTEKLDRCVAPLHELVGEADEQMREVRVEVGAPWYTLDDPGAHRQALLRRALVPLAEVAELDGVPPQFDASATRCTSSGRVGIVSRSAGGIGLNVDLTCTTVLSEAPAAEHTTSPV